MEFNQSYNLIYNAIIFFGFTAINLVILALNLKIFTEITKDKLQDKRHLEKEKVK